ncbi:hypothetical protein MP638_005343 [Amoeboaphelidium occidentale]|nr:hypothetical protein MP638_005343 [Amoeboaphelidium occidentale]
MTSMTELFVCSLEALDIVAQKDLLVQIQSIIVISPKHILVLCKKYLLLVSIDVLRHDGVEVVYSLPLNLDKELINPKLLLVSTGQDPVVVLHGLLRNDILAYKVSLSENIIYKTASISCVSLSNVALIEVYRLRPTGPFDGKLIFTVASGSQMDKRGLMVVEVSKRCDQMCKVLGPFYFSVQDISPDFGTNILGLSLTDSNDYLRVLFNKCCLEIEVEEVLRSNYVPEKDARCINVRRRRDLSVEIVSVLTANYALSGSGQLVLLDFEKFGQVAGNLDRVDFVSMISESELLYSDYQSSLIASWRLDEAKRTELVSTNNALSCVSSVIETSSESSHEKTMLYLSRNSIFYEMNKGLDAKIESQCSLPFEGINAVFNINLHCENILVMSLIEGGFVVLKVESDGDLQNVQCPSDVDYGSILGVHSFNEELVICFEKALIYFSYEMSELKVSSITSLENAVCCCFNGDLVFIASKSREVFKYWRSVNAFSKVTVTNIQSDITVLCMCDNFIVAATFDGSFLFYSASDEPNLLDCLNLDVLAESVCFAGASTFMVGFRDGSLRIYELKDNKVQLVWEQSNLGVLPVKVQGSPVSGRWILQSDKTWILDFNPVSKKVISLKELVLPDFKSSVSVCCFGSSSFKIAAILDTNDLVFIALPQKSQSDYVVRRVETIKDANAMCSRIFQDKNQLMIADISKLYVVDSMTYEISSEMDLGLSDQEKVLEIQNSDVSSDVIYVLTNKRFLLVDIDIIMRTEKQCSIEDCFLFCSKGNRVILARRRITDGFTLNSLVLLDTDNMTQINEKKMRYPVTSLSFSDTDAFLYVGEFGGGLSKVDIQDSTFNFIYSQGQLCYTVGLQVIDSQYTLSYDYNGHIHLFDLLNYKRLLVFYLGEEITSVHILRRSKKNGKVSLVLVGNLGTTYEIKKIAEPDFQLLRKKFIHDLSDYDKKYKYYTNLHEVNVIVWDSIVPRNVLPNLSG